MVSKKKKRVNIQTHFDDYNFDMTYITSRIIAMAYPSGSKTNYWRNHRMKVAAYFKEMHGGQVKIYNLCIEKGFCIDDSYIKDFPYKMLEFECLDHEPHKFIAMFEFNIDALIYLSYSSNNKNVIAVHWKAGKGRTGVMICSLLIFLGFDFPDSKEISEDNPEEQKLQSIPKSIREGFKNYRRYNEDETPETIEKQITKTYYGALGSLHKFIEKVMEFYATARTHDKKGITIQSQIRFLKMYALYLFNRFKLEPLRDLKK